MSDKLSQAIRIIELFRKIQKVWKHTEINKYCEGSNTVLQRLSVLTQLGCLINQIPIRDRVRVYEIKIASLNH